MTWVLLTEVERDAVIELVKAAEAHLEADDAELDRNFGSRRTDEAYERLRVAVAPFLVGPWPSRRCR